MLSPRKLSLLLALTLLGTAGVSGWLAVHAQMPTAPGGTARFRPWPLPIPRPLPPFLPPIQGLLTIDAVHVHADISGGVARTEVEQLWRNDTDRAEEGSYLFPLPEGASITDFALYDGDRKLDGRLLDKDQAAGTYEGIVRQMRDPALLRYIGRGAYEVKLYPVPAHATRRITLHYVQPLAAEGSGGTRRFECAFLSGGGQAPRTATVEIKLADPDALASVYSPTHEVSIKRTTDRTATVSWEAKEGRVPTDFLLYYGTTRQAPVGLSLLAYNVSLPRTQTATYSPGSSEGKRDSGYFLLMAAPTLAQPGQVAPPRRLVLTLDRSGSMGGDKIEQARKALVYVLKRLRPQDQFSVLTFNESVDKFSDSGLLPATPANITRAVAFVNDIRAEGSTNINDALQATLKQFPAADDGRPNMTIFLTDGLPTVGETDQNKITEAARLLSRPRHVRLFDFGVGYDVDVPFLDRLAEANRGDADYVRPEEDIEAKVSHFYEKVASPVLTDLHLQLAGAATTETYPRPSDLPDLFAGSQLLIAGRYTGSGPVTATLSGTVNGKPASYTLSAALPALAAKNDFLPRLWATRKIASLLDAIRLRQSDSSSSSAEDPALVSEIVRLSKEYGVITPYTSFLATETGGEPIPPPLPGPFFRGGGGGFGGGFGGSGVIGSAGGNVYDGGALHRAPSAVAAPAPTRIYALPGLTGQSSGANATTQSQTLKAARRATLADGLAGYDAAGARDAATHVRAVGAKTFLLKGGVWTDSAFDPAKNKTVTTVRAYSDAQFALLKALPALTDYAALGDSVLIVLDNGEALRFSPTEGRQTLDAATQGKLEEK